MPLRPCLLAGLLLSLLAPVPPAAAQAPARNSAITVRGVVHGPGGAAQEGARVHLVPKQSDPGLCLLELEGNAHPAPAATAVTGSDGGFSLQAPEIGMWTVRVEAPGQVPQEIDLVPLVAETDLPAVKLERDMGLQVRVAGADGSPVAGARVRADVDTRSSTGLQPGWRPAARIALADAKGTAVLPRGARERLRVRAGMDGPFATQEGVRGASLALRLAAGASRPIRVVDAAGKPVANVSVRVGDSLGCAGRTSADGLFAVRGSRSGKERVLLSAADGRQLESWLQPPGTTDKEKGPLTLRLPGLVSVTGRVVSALDGRPVAGALVWGNEPGAARRTGVDGSYGMEVPPGQETWMQAAAPGYFPARIEVSADPGRRRAPTLALEPALSAAGVVVDETGKPVGGVEIRATPQPSGPPRAPGLLRSGGTVRTAPSGRFRLSPLAGGMEHELHLSKAGYAPATSEVPPLEPGRPAADLRLVLRKGRTGFGRIVNQAEQPIAGAEVALRPVESGDRARRLMRMLNPSTARYEAATGADGRFEIPDLPAGTYELKARGPGHAPMTVPGLTVPQGAGRTDLGTVILPPGVAVDGLVVDGEGAPVAGAEVSVAEPSGERFAALGPQGDAAAPVITGADGSFRVEDRRAGETLDLVASRPGYAPGRAQGVQVPAAAPLRIVLQLTSAIEGRTVDSDGKPVAGATIYAMPMQSSGGMRIFSSSLALSARSAEDGTFRIEEVEPGSVELSASAPGYQATQLSNLEVRPGQDLMALEVVLSPGAVVEGRVASSAGRPVAGATVRLAALAENTAHNNRFFSLMAPTDADGRYRLEGVPPGLRTLQAEHPGHRSTTRELQVRLGENTLDLTFEGGAEVRGRVVDGEGAPVANARVYLRAGWRSWDLPSTASASDGSFTLAGVPDGAYRVHAEKEGFARNEEGEAVDVSGSPVAGIEVRLSSGGAIVGQLRGLDFTELSQVRVQADGRGQAGVVSPDGSYRVDNVPPGERRVVAALPGGSRQAEGTVTLEPGASEARLDLDFTRGVVLSGRVTRNGRPSAGDGLILSAPDSAGRWGDTDHEGRFRFEGLKPGRYELVVHGGRGDARHRETLELDEDREILVELRTVTVSGRVIDAEDQSPVANATVTLVPPQGEEPGGAGMRVETGSDSRGLFRLSDVSEGAWKVRAVLPGYAPAEMDIQVDAGSPVDGLELALQATEGLTVEVFLASGRPPDLVQGVVVDPMGRVVASGSWPIGEEGRLRIASVPPGSWELVLDATTAAPVSVPVTAPGHAGRVVLPRPGGLDLRVPALADTGMGARVRLNDTTGRVFRVPQGGQALSELPLSGGARRFERLPPGNWGLTVTADDGRTWNGKVAIVPGGMAQVTLE